MTIKNFTQSELQKLAEKERQAREQMGDNGTAEGRATIAQAAQFKAEHIGAMWKRVLARLAEGGAK